MATRTSRDELHKAIGAMIVQWGGLETVMRQLFGHVLGCDNRRAGAALDCIRSFSTKIELIEAVFTAHSADIPKNNEIPEIIAELKRINRQRNDLVHDTWISLGLEGDLYQVGRKSLKKGHPWKPVNLDAIKLLRSDIYKLELTINQLRVPADSQRP